jgi:ribosomal protein S18 acetylase RimI-like enzyme
MIGTPSQYSQSKVVGTQSPTSLKTGEYFMNLKEGTEIVGSLLVKKWKETYIIQDVFVKQEFRGKGYGKQLLKEIVTFLKPKKKEIYLYVDPDNNVAISLYKSVGFHLIKEKAWKGDKYMLLV